MPEQIFSGKYIVQEEIARGGMGVIYKALDRTLNRIVAIKRIHAHLSGDPSFSDRFLREARAMARIQHDNIVTIFAVEEDAGTQLLVMEFFGPTNLRTLIRQPHRLPLREVVRIGEQLASALAYAHGQGIIHRDIKPANVLIDKRGKAKLTDFGIAAALDEASITSTGQVIGTPEYMSPEQARGVKVDGRSDLYSLGIMLYEMVNGKPPYVDTSKTAILGKLVFEQHELSLQFPAGVPSMLQGVIQDLLRRNPDDRIPDAETLTSQLHEILYTLPHSPAVAAAEHAQATAVTSLNPAPLHEPTRLVSSNTATTEQRPEPLAATVLLDEETRLVSPPPSPPTQATTRKSAPPLDDTRLLPSQPPPPPPPRHASTPKASPPPLPPPTPPRPSASFPLLPLLGGGLLLAGAAVALVWYLGTQLDTRLPESPPTPSSHPDRSGDLEAKLKEREDNMAKLEELIRRTADRLPAEQYSSECPVLKAYLVELYEKYQDAVREVNLVREQLSREALPGLSRPNQLDLTCENAKHPPSPKPKSAPKPKPVTVPPSPKPEPKLTPPLEIPPQLSSLLTKFQRAYERCDLEALQSLSRMSENRLNNAEFMFANYSAFTTTIQDVAPTEKGATAVLMLETGTRHSGEVISIPDKARTVKLRIIREGNDWIIEW